MTTQFTYDVFLSHNSQDKPRVRGLAKKLKAAGLRVWFDEWLIKPGDDIYLAIERGIEASRVQILCLSPAALGSDWVSLERSTVLFRDPSNAGRRFIPLLLADCDLPDTLRHYKYVDFRQEASGAFHELLAACRSAEQSPAPPKETKSPPSESFKGAQPTKPTGKPRTTQPKPEPEQPEPLAILERKLPGHTGAVLSVAVGPDGKWAASGAKDTTVKVWDLETGNCRATLQGHVGQLRSVAITPDGRRILSGSTDESIRLWDAGSGRELARLTGHTDQVQSLVTFQDNARALSGSWDNTLRIWDLSTGECLKTIKAGESHIIRYPGTDLIHSTAVGRDGKQALTGHSDGHVRLWDLETGKRLATMEGHANSVLSVKITPDGRFAVSSSSDTTVKVWNLETGTFVGTLEGHKKPVHSVAISPDGSLIASAGFLDHTVRLWGFKSGACVQVIDAKAPISPISVAFSPDGSRLVVGTSEGAVYLYRLTVLRPERPAEASRRYVNAKVVLVGESGVGKSGLAYRLIEDRFVETRSTHGMQVWRLDLPEGPHRLSADEEVLTEREALLWDLAGQEDYRLIHQLFLDETALGLVLFNPQRDDPFTEPAVWTRVLHAIGVQSTASREIARLLIAARTDVGDVKVSRQKIETFLKDHGFSAYLATSAYTGRNCSDTQNAGKPSALKALIAKHIPWDKLPWTSTPRLLAGIKNAVIDLREKKQVRLLRFAELCQRLEQVLPRENFGEADVRIAITHLANHGLVAALKFGDLVLMLPELLNGYSSAVIRAARTHVDEIGCVREADVYDPGFDFTGVERLERPDEQLLLRAMVQTFLDKSLCIAEDTPDGRHLIFPSQYRRERPIPEYPEIFVSYTFTGELQTIYTTLVVRLWYSREFEHKELWQNAAEFKTPKGRTVGLVMARTGEGEGTISVFFEPGVPEELQWAFIKYIHGHLAQHARDVHRDRRYVCPACHKPVTDLQAVRDRLDANKDFITCQKCDKRVPLIDFIEQRLASDPVAQRVVGMDRKATIELDAQALEQILIGHMMAICGEANQLFRPVTMFDYGIDGEVEFKDNDGRGSGKRVYVQLKSGESHLRTRKGDGKEIFDVKKDWHIECWVNQPADVYLVIRDGEGVIRWMNVTEYLKTRKDKDSHQIIFDGEKLDAPAVWRLRDKFISPRPPTRPAPQE